MGGRTICAHDDIADDCPECKLGGPCHDFKVIDERPYQCALSRGHRGDHEAKSFVTVASWPKVPKRRKSTLTKGPAR